MPRASFASKDTVDVNFGVQEGVVEIIGAVTKVHQYPPNKNSGEQSGPFPCVQLTLVMCDDAGERLPEGGEIHEEFKFGDIAKFHPGKAASADDEDPEDLGAEVDTEGNCVYVADEAAKMSKKCKWILFATSLEDKGFKSEILGRGYMPDLVGLKVRVKTVPGTKIPGQTYKKDPTQLVADKILQFPYEKKAAKKGPVSAKPAASGASGSKPAAAAAASGGPEELAVRFLTEIVTEFAGKEIERKKLQTAVQTKLMRGKVPVAQHKPVLDLVKSDAWLKAQIGSEPESDEAAFYGKIIVDFDADPQTVSFGAE